MLNTIAFILGLVLIGVAGLAALMLGQMARDHARQSTFKKIDNQMMWIGLIFILITGGVGALMVWLTYERVM